MARVGGRRPTTPSFTHTFRLNVDGHQGALLDARFEAGRRVYNAILDEALQRARRMRESRLWSKARKTRDGARRAALFKRARERHGLRLFDLFPLVGDLCHGESGNYLDTTTARGIGKRAYDAVNDWVLGKRGRPRFKSRRRGLRTLAGLEHEGIRLVRGGGTDTLACLEVRWKGLRLPVRLRHGKRPTRHGDGHRRVAEYALGHRVKFVRLLRHIHGTQVRYYAQVVFAGVPLARVAAGTETVGLDVGVSTAAWVAETKAGLVPFAPGLADYRKARRRLLRRVDRQRRAGNPENYNPDGTVKAGRRRWKVSRRQADVERQLADLARRQADQRRNENGRLANRIVGAGKYVRTEDVTIRAWAKLFGRQIGRSAPAGVLAAIHRKAESAGGALVRLPLRLALSQHCVCGHRERKPLSQRVHHCPRCGLRMQRDLLSAYLARYADLTTLHADQARESWSATEPLLLTAWGVPQFASPTVALAPRWHRGDHAAVGADREQDVCPEASVHQVAVARAFSPMTESLEEEAHRSGYRLATELLSMHRPT